MLQRRHLYVLITPALVFAVCAALLIRDFKLENASEQHGPTLARVSNAVGDVKRKPDKRLRWFQLSGNQDVYARDTIRTAKGSTTQIKLSNGSTIQVGESSLIVLEQSRDKIAIEFVSGSIFSKGNGKGVVLKSQGVSIDAGSAQVELSATKGGAASVVVKDGQVSAEANGKTTVIAENQKGTFTAGVVGEIETLPVKLLKPDADFLALSEEGDLAVDFAWELLKDVKDARLEIAEDRDFGSIVKTVRPREKGRATHVGLKAGAFFWRIASEEKALSDVRRVELQAKAPIRLLDPETGVILKFSKVAPKVRFQWTGPAYLDGYAIELAEDASFRKILRTEKIENATQASIALEQSGTIHWRVVGKSARVPGQVESPTRTISLRKLDRLEPPQALAPAQGSPIALDAKSGGELQFRWSASEEASEYLLEIAADDSFREPLESSKTAAASFKWKPKREGRFYWRISAFDFDHQLVPAKKTQELIIVSGTPIRLATPADHERFVYIDDRPAVKLGWEEEQTAKTYEVQLAKDASFREITLTAKATSPAHELDKLPDGSYFWRVRAVDASGTPFRESTVRSFELRAKDLLAAPELVGPAQGHALFSLVPEDVELDFSWKPVEGAVSYVLVIEKRGAEGESAREPAAADESAKQEQKTRAPAFHWKRLEAGSYAWGVRAVDSAGRSSKLGILRPFLVKREATLAPPEAIEAIVEQRRR